jgi:NAD dependent epimerase/dehydratase
MNWTSKRVAVTGAGGFIGSHLAEALVRAGASVTAVTRYNSRGDEGNLRFVEDEVRAAMTVRSVDMVDLDAVRQAIGGHDIVFNLAAFIGIPYSYVNPQGTVANNVASTLNVLLLAKEGVVGRVMQTSTSEVYGSALQVPIPETHPYQPQSPYSASKIATDNIALSFHLSFGTPVTIVRPFNTYGPRQSARAVLPSVISQALAGSDIKVGSTTTTRDFNYVGDTVRGFMLLAASDQSLGRAVNIGSGREISIADAIETIVRVVGNQNRIVHDEQRVRPEKSEVNRLLADIALARELVGYEPEVSFDEGIRRTVDWMAEHLDVFRPHAYNV